MIKKINLRKKDIEKKLSDILDSIELIEKNLPEDFDQFLMIGLKKDGIYKKIEFVIQNFIDLCNILNSDLRLGVPDIEEDIFDHLETKNILSKKTLDIIKEMKRFRNVLVHKYGEINDELAYEEIKKGLCDFEFLIEEFEKFLQKSK